MTYNELRLHVSRLGFEQGVEDDDSLICAANRALAMLFIDYPQAATARIYVSAPRLTTVYKKVKHYYNQTELLPLVGAAFSFLPHGSGSCTLTDENGTTRVEFNATGEFVKGVINGSKASIRFEGEADYTVTALAAFEGSFKSNPASIPEYCERRTVNMRDYIGDFRTLAALPRFPDGKIATDAEPMGSTLRIPFLFDGELVVDYLRTPSEIVKSQTPIDLPAAAEQLFPLLVASFIWLDDDAEKAQYYMALYKSGIADAVRSARAEHNNKYVTNGWA